MSYSGGDPERKVPLLPVRDLVLFPGVIVPLFVGRPRSLKALEEAMLHEKTVLVVAQKDMNVRTLNRRIFSKSAPSRQSCRC